MALANTERNREVAELLVAIRHWAERRADIVGVVLAGSWAVGNPRMSSALQLCLLCEAPGLFLDHEDWAQEIGSLQFASRSDSGDSIGFEFLSEGGLVVDLQFKNTAWASTRVLHDDACAVAKDGVVLLYDPQRILSRFVASVGAGVNQIPNSVA